MSDEKTLPEVVDGFIPNASQRIILNSFSLMRPDDQKKTIISLIESNAELKKILLSKIDTIKGVEVPIKPQRKARLKEMQGISIEAGNQEETVTESVCEPRVKKVHKTADNQIVEDKYNDTDEIIYRDGYKVNRDKDIFASEMVLRFTKEYHRVLENKEEQKYQEACKKLKEKYGEEKADEIIDLFKNTKEGFCSKEFIDKFKRYVNFTSESTKKERLWGFNTAYVYFCFENGPACSESKKYSSKDSLFRHLHAEHFFGIEPFKCPHCGMRQRNQIDHDYHLRSHMSLKTYQCLECDYAVHERRYMQDHVKSHRGLFRYECHLCPRKFQRAADRKKHVETHKPFAKAKICWLCDDTPELWSTADVTNHRNEKHPKEESATRLYHQMRCRVRHNEQLFRDGGMSKEILDAENQLAKDEYHKKLREQGIDPEVRAKANKKSYKVRMAKREKLLGKEGAATPRRTRKPRQKSDKPDTSPKDSSSSGESSSESDSSDLSDSSDSSTGSESQTQSESELTSPATNRPRRSAAKKAKSFVRAISKSELTDNDDEELFEGLSLHSPAADRADSPEDEKPTLEQLEAELAKLKSLQNKSRAKPTRYQKGSDAESQSSSSSESSSDESESEDSESGSEYDEKADRRQATKRRGSKRRQDSDSSSLSNSSQSESSDSGDSRADRDAGAFTDPDADEWDDWVVSTGKAEYVPKSFIDDSVKVIKINGPDGKTKRKKFTRPKKNAPKPTAASNAEANQNVGPETTALAAAAAESNANTTTTNGVTETKKNQKVSKEKSLLETLSQLGPQLDLSNLTKKYLSLASSSKLRTKKATKRNKKRLRINDDDEWEAATDDEANNSQTTVTPVTESIQTAQTESYTVPNLQDLHSPAQSHSLYQ